MALRAVAALMPMASPAAMSVGLSISFRRCVPCTGQTRLVKSGHLFFLAVRACRVDGSTQQVIKRRQTKGPPHSASRGEGGWARCCSLSRSDFRYISVRSAKSSGTSTLGHDPEKLAPLYGVVTAFHLAEEVLADSDAAGCIILTKRHRLAAGTNEGAEGLGRIEDVFHVEPHVPEDT